MSGTRAFLPVLFAVVDLVISSQASAQVETWKTVDLPGDKLLGRYSVLADGQPLRRSFREDQINRSLGRDDPKLEGGELRGRVTYRGGTGLWIALTENDQGSIAYKLNALNAIDPRDIHALAIRTVTDFVSLKEISRFENLRDLTLVVDEVLEGDEGCHLLGQLKKLSYLELYRTDGCIFGSKKFCETVRSLSALKHLSIPCEKLTDANVAILASHPNLERIHLRARRPVLGSHSLQALKNAPRLRELFIVCTDTISDADVMGLADAKALEFFHLVTRAPITCQELLKQRRPDCWFAFDEPSNDIQ
jgi:hypothetical protein